MKIKYQFLILFLVTIMIVVVAWFAFTHKQPKRFYLWTIGDPHGNTKWDDDISFNGAHWSGDMINSEVPRIDFAIDVGDIQADGAGYGYANPKILSDYINDTHSCLLPNRDMSTFWSSPANERIWGFVGGNHDWGKDKWGENTAIGLGLDSSANWYDNSVTYGKCFNYSILRDNLLFLFYSEMGNRSCIDGSTVKPRIWEEDWPWFLEQLEWAKYNQINVIMCTHRPLWNGSIWQSDGKNIHSDFYNTSSGQWEPCIHDKYTSGWQDAHYNEGMGFPAEGWNASDEYWTMLNNSDNVIRLWISGHVHRNPSDVEGHNPPHDFVAWDDTRGVERNIQKSKYCTFIDTGGIGPYDFGWSYSRVIIFEEGSKDIIIKTYNHVDDEYMDDDSHWSSAKDITITNVLKYPYKPD